MKKIFLRVNKVISIDNKISFYPESSIDNKIWNQFPSYGSFKPLKFESKINANKFIESKAFILYHESGIESEFKINL